MKKKIMAVIILIIFIVATFLIGTGFRKRTDVVLFDYSVSEDGTAINLGVQVASSMGYVRGFKDNGGGVKPHYLTFYSTFGGLNSSFGTVNSFTLEIDSDDTEIYFNRPNGGYELVLIKDEETSTWIKPHEDIALLSENFWKSVQKVIYYDFDEEIYELSDIGKFEKLQEIFEGMSYKEIENPWIEGWYLFKIQTEKNTYDLNITGKTISFNGKFYEVDNSVAKEILTIIKAEESTQVNDELTDREAFLAKNLITEEEKVLTADEGQLIVDILESINWVEGAPACDNDYMITIINDTYYYHSDCGTFLDIVNNKSKSLSEEEKERVNNYIKY